MMTEVRRVSQEQQPPGEHPVPIIDPTRCRGCGLCVRACPTGALALKDGVAVVMRPAVCDYSGCCVAICRQQAIDRCFQIVDGRKGEV